MNAKAPTNANYKSLNILRFKQLLKLEDCKFGFKLMNASLPPKSVNYQQLTNVEKASTNITCITLEIRIS